MDEKQLQALYEAMQHKLELGSFDQFKSTIYKDGKYRKAFYDEANHELDLGDFDAFENSFKKKGSLGQVGAIGSALSIGTGLSGGSGSEKNNEPLGFGQKAKQSVMSGIFHPDVTIDHEDPAKSILSSYDRDIENAKESVKPSIVRTGFEGAKSINPESLQDIQTAHKQITDLTKEKKDVEQNLIATDKGAREWLFREGKVINPLNTTDRLALQTHMKRQAWDMAEKDAPTFDEAVVAMTGKKKEDIPEATLGRLVDEKLHDPLVIEKAQESQDFQNKYQQAKTDLYDNYPAYAFKKVGELIGQKLEDEKMTGWLYANPSLKKVEKAIEMLKADGSWGDNEDRIFKQKFLPYIAGGAADKVIPLTDFLHQTGYGIYEGAKNFDASGRDIINKITGGVIDPEGNGLFQNFGLMENNQDRTKRLAEEQASTLTVTPTRDFTKVFAPLGNFTGQFTPMIIGSAMGVPEVLNTTLMFEGNNADRARQLFKGDVGKQNLYTLLGTTFDVFAGKALPTKKAAQGFKNLMENDIKSIITDLSDKKITEEVAQKTLWDKAFEYTKRVAGGNTKTAAVLEGYNLAHKGLDAAFGKRNFNVENELQEAISDYPTNWLNSTFLSGMASVHGAEQPINGQMYKKLADNTEYFRDVINKDDKLSPIDKQDRLEKLDHLEAVNMLLEKKDLKPEQKEKYLNTSMQQFVAQKAVKEAADKVLAKEDERKAKIAEVEKEHIITPMSNTALLENLYDHLPTLDKGMLSTEGKFDENKVGEYLKSVAQQFNNMTESEGGKWKENTTDPLDMSYLPESIIEAANKRWKDKIEEADEAAQSKEETPTIDQERELDIGDAAEEKFDDIVSRSKTSEPIEFVGYRTGESPNMNEKTGMFFSDSDFVDLLIKRTNDGWDHYNFKGEKNKYQIKLKNPLKISNKEDLLNEIAKNGERNNRKEAKRILKNYKDTMDFEHDKADIIITEEMKKKGYDGVIYEDEVQVFDKSAITPVAAPESTATIQEGADQQKIAANENPVIETSVEEIKPVEPIQSIGEEAKPSEIIPPTATESGEEVTGIKKSIVEPLRHERGLPKVQVPKLGKDAEILQKGKEMVDAGEIDPREVVNKVLADKNGGIYTPEEAGAMLYYGHQLSAKEADLKEVRNASEKDSKEWLSAQSDLQQLSDEIDSFSEANRINSNSWGRLGNTMQIEVDPSFNASNIRTIIKDNYNGEIPKEVQAKMDEALKQRDLAIEELKKAKEDAALNEIKKDKKYQERKSKRKQNKEELKKEREEILSDLHQSIKKDLDSPAFGIPLSLATIKSIGELALNYFKDGVLTMEGLTDKIYHDLKGAISGLDKRTIREAISSYMPLREEARTKEETRLERKEADINKQIATGIFKTKGEKTNIVYRKTNDMLRAEARIGKAQHTLRQLKRISFESKKNYYQKALMWASRLVRLSVLSGYKVLYKLSAAATIGAGLKRPFEQAIGKFYGEVFKSISDKAPIEGSFNALSEAKFYKEFFDPKKFAQNSWEILKTGSSHLTHRLGEKDFEHVPVLYLPTDLHAIIKDPPKRATFEASFRNGLIWAEKNGYDINDPLVVNTIENAAFKRAEYEIFQESNIFNKAFRQFLQKMEARGNIGATGKFIADFMIPVSTVPTNIVRRVITTSPVGLIRGAGKVIDAYRKGIENLSNQEAETIMRQLKQGTFGTALWLIGWFGASHFGGLYTRFNPNKKRDDDELKSDQMLVGGELIDKPVQHALPLEIIQLAATARHIWDDAQDKKETDFNALYHTALGSIGALIEQVPVLETGVHAVMATGDPYEAKKLGEDIKRRFEPQILRETGVILPKKKEDSARPQLPERPKISSPKRPALPVH